MFHPLSFEDLAKIAKIFITNLSERLKTQGLQLKVTESALKYIIEKGYNPEYGARPLRRLIEQEIENRVAEEMLSNNVTDGSTIVVGFRAGELAVSVK